MKRLTSFSTPANVVVVGASGGIGRAVCSLLASDPGVARIHALSRTGGIAGDDRLRPGVIDIEDEASIRDAAVEIGDEAIDLVFVVTGILHDGDSLGPERRMSELSPDVMRRVFAINAFGPALVAKHFLGKLRRPGKSVFAALSARVGSIGDNRLGGWASYRASKAALNQLIRTLSIEHARRFPDSVVVALHPGTVDTRLSEPFTSRTPPDKLFNPEKSAASLLQVIDGLNADDSGGFFAWDGTPIEF